MKPINVEHIHIKKRRYIQMGELDLKSAITLLHLHCDEWDKNYEIQFRQLLDSAQAFFTKAQALEEILDDIAAESIGQM